MLWPIFRAYDDFREKRKIEKLRKIALEKKEREKQIKEERRLRYEAKQQELRDEVKLAKELPIKHEITDCLDALLIF